MRPKNLALFAYKFGAVGQKNSKQGYLLAVGEATFIVKRRGGGDILGALPPNPRPWRAALASVLPLVADLHLRPMASLIVKVLCGALLAVGAATKFF